MSFRRCGVTTVLVVEDTTDLNYTAHHKQGPGRPGGAHRKPSFGLNTHTALCLTPQGQCLGIVHQHIWAPRADHAGHQRHQ